MKRKEQQAQRNKPRLSTVEQLHEAHIEIEGNREFILDGCKGILEYSDERIKICTNTNAVGVAGEDLSIVSYTDEQILISGSIVSIDFS